MGKRHEQIFHKETHSYMEKKTLNFISNQGYAN